MTPENEQQKFLKKLDLLERQFVSLESSKDTVKKIQSDLMDYFLSRERARRGVSNRRSLWPVVDAETVTTMGAWDTNDPSYVLAEKTLRRFTEGRGEDAVNLLTTAIESRKRELSIAQSKRAKADRSNHPLAKIIKEIVLEDAAIDGQKLLQKLKRLCGGGELKHIDDDEIHFQNPKIKSVKVKGLKDRLSRAKKKYSR